MGGRVLIIDDDLFMRKLIAMMLTRDGYTILQAASAPEGLALLKEQGADAVTCDLMMPEVDGLEFLRRLKADPTLANTPVVVITAAGLEDSISTARDLGAIAVVEKPFTDVQIRQAVSAAVNPA